MPQSFPRLLAALITASLPASIVVAAEELAPDGFTVVDTLDAVRLHAGSPGVKIRLKPGIYRLEKAVSRHFIVLSGADSHWDFRGVKLQIDNTLFRQRFPASDRGDSFYCAISITGNRVVLEGLATENDGDQPGIQGRNKIFSITGSGVVLRNVDVTTAGSSPWGYGSLFGIAGGDVKKMNGIRIGAPANGVKLIGCRVHMRAMGHAIFVQGAQNTLIEDCYIDGLLRPTNEILAEKSGYAFARNFITRGSGYIEGTRVAPDGRILANEMIALSEDGIRMYDRFAGQPTGSTTIRNCTVTRMRRGICTGLGPGADAIINCEARECVAAGYNIGSGDGLENCRADAKYSEAICLPYLGARGASVDLEILDSHGGQANDLLAAINGREHRVRLWTKTPANIPPKLDIALATTRGYAFYQQGRGTPTAKNIQVTNETLARIVLSAGATGNSVLSQGEIIEEIPEGPMNVIKRF